MPDGMMFDNLIREYLTSRFLCYQNEGDTGWGADPGGFGQDVTDTGWGADPGGFGQGGGRSASDWATDYTNWMSTPFSPSQYADYQDALINKGIDQGPWVQNKMLSTQALGWPGFTDKGMAPATSYSPLNTPAPKFLRSLYPLSPGSTFQDFLSQAQKGVKNWMTGGPDAPRILTPNEWNQMLPSEQEGLMGFLDYIGIPWGDYSEMMRRQQDAVMQSFGTDLRFRPARQR